MLIISLVICYLKAVSFLIPHVLFFQKAECVTFFKEEKINIYYIFGGIESFVGVIDRNLLLVFERVGNYLVWNTEHNLIILEHCTCKLVIWEVVTAYLFTTFYLWEIKPLKVWIKIFEKDCASRARLKYFTTATLTIPVLGLKFITRPFDCFRMLFLFHW